ncbi:MAG: hypothetical protein JJE10_00620 [Thermoleophilia bacterium]|nr:hypothetical protein [Thermoleophilia bacterium]
MSFEVLDRARERWGELLAGEVDSAERRAELGDRLFEEGIVAGDRPLLTVLRPHLITEELLARQTRAAELVFSAAVKVRDGVLSDERLHRLHFGPFMEWVGELVELDAASPVADGALARLDASLARTRLHFLELNADAPGGAGHHDSILEYFAELETFRAFEREYRVRPLPLIPPLLEAQLTAWRQFGGRGRPSITLMTRTGDPVRTSSLEINAERFRRHGIDASVCDYRELSFENGRLKAGEREVELLLRAMPTVECLDLRDDMKPLFSAVRTGSVCMVNPFRSELLGHKGIFALMTDPAHDFGFTAAERRAVREHVPWGRRLTDEATSDPAGRKVGLVDHVLAEREHLVLKPAHQFGGSGVMLGWRQDQAEWERSVREALGSDYIVQRRVPLHGADYPTITGTPAEQSYFEDTDPFMFGGRSGGLLTRLSLDEITNVHTGGSVAASFAIEPLG